MINKIDEIKIPVKNGEIKGLLNIPYESLGIVLFAHGSGSSRFSHRNQLVASELNEANFATLLMDLLTEEEGHLDDQTAQLRFDIRFLSQRLIEVTNWVNQHRELKNLNCGYFGASTGAAAALVAAAEIPHQIKAIVSRGGRPDLAGKLLAKVTAPTLLIVGGHDHGVIELNQTAFEMLACEKRIEIVPGATHLFEEPGTLIHVAHLASTWFQKHL